MGDDPIVSRQPLLLLDGEMELHKISHPSPGDLVLLYEDPQGDIQGPFVGSDIISWFEFGYFGIELQVRLASTPADSPFSLLGDVMPHLRSLARPPPGFSNSKTNKIREASGWLNYSSFQKLHGISNKADGWKTETRHKYGSTIEVEKGFPESLMGSSTSTAQFEKFTLPEGLQGYSGNNSTAPIPVGFNCGDDPYLMAKKDDAGEANISVKSFFILALERCGFHSCKDGFSE